MEISYLQQEEIGGIIAKGLAVLYHEQPQFPIDYLAKWLITYAQNQKLKLQFEEEQLYKQNLITKHETDLNEAAHLKLQQQKLVDAEIQNETFYKDRIRSHLYHDELLEKIFCDQLKMSKSLSGVYACELDFPRKQFSPEQDDDEQAHIDPNGTKILRYIAASSGQKFLIDLTLQRDTGVTYLVLQEQQPDENGIVPQNIGIYVPDVVKDARIVYHQWPKLGAFFAVPLVYNSVLQEEYFNSGVEQRQIFHRAREEQKKERDLKEQELEEQIQQKIEAGEDQTLLEQELKSYKEGFEEVKEAPFQILKREFVLCADTLSQDREISEKDRNYILDYAILFAKSQEDRELQDLSDDIDRQLIYIKNVGFNHKELLDSAQQEEDQHVDANAAQFEDLREKNEKEYAYEIDCLRLEKIKEQMADRNFIQPLLNLSENRLIKFPAVLQAAFYLLHYDKQLINIPGTNILNWRFAKTLLNDSLIEKLVAYSHKGPKDQTKFSYGMVNRIQKRLEKIELEQVELYCLPYGRILKLLNYYCKLRKVDIEIRRFKISQKRILIQTLQEETAKTLDDKQKQIIIDKELITPEDLETIIMEEWEASWDAQWDAEHPLPEIPENPEDQVDEDYEFEQI